MSRASPAMLHFPEAPRSLWGSASNCEDVQQFLTHVLQWRDATLQWLDGPARPLTPELARLLRWCLSTHPERPLSVPPYRLMSFPAQLDVMSVRAPAPCEQVRQWGLDAMRWRAHVVDFLADVWDTVGKPLFDMEECGYATDELLMPSPAPGIRFCPDCLERFPEPDTNGRLREHYGSCPVRRMLDQPEGAKSQT